MCLFSFIYRERHFFTNICIIIVILTSIIDIPVYFITYKHYYHRQHYHKYINDPVKVEVSNVTLYQFGVQPTLSYNVSLSFDII